MSKFQLNGVTNADFDILKPGRLVSPGDHWRKLLDAISVALCDPSQLIAHMQATAPDDNHRYDPNNPNWAHVTPDEYREAMNSILEDFETNIRLAYAALDSAIEERFPACAVHAQETSK